MSVGITIGVVLGAQMIAGNGAPSRSVPVLRINTVSDFTVSDRPLQLDVGVRVTGENLNVTNAETFSTLDWSVGLKRRFSKSWRFATSIECGAVSQLGVEDVEPQRFCGAGVIFDTTPRGRVGLHVMPYDERLGARGWTAQFNGQLDMAPATSTIGATGFMRAIIGRAGHMRVEVGVGVSR